MAGIRDHVMKAHNYEMETKEMIARRAGLDASKAKYTEALGADLEKHLRVAVKLVTLLKKAVTEKPAQESIPTIMSSLASLSDTHEDLKTWAEKFDLVAKSSAKKRRARGSAGSCRDCDYMCTSLGRACAQHQFEKNREQKTLHIDTLVTRHATRHAQFSECTVLN